MNLATLPKWTLPVGGGGILAIGFLVTKRSKTPTPITVTPGNTTGDTPGGTTDPSSWIASLTTLLTQNQQALTDALTGETQSQQTQLTTFLQNFTSLQSGTTDQITQLLAAQQASQQAGQTGIQNLITAFEQQVQQELDAMMQLVQGQPSAGGSGIIDALKKAFSTAFQRITKPNGTAVPNSDITIGTLTNAPYASDPGFTYYDTTGQLVTGPFRQFLGNFGHATTWGRPISQVFRTPDGYDTQVFEHAIFKYIPHSDPTHYDIMAIAV